MATDLAISTAVHQGVCGCGGRSLGLSRRGVLAATGATLLSAALWRPVRAQTAITPDAALARLMGANKRYTSGKLNSRSEDFAAERKESAGGQHPFATVLSCADSRVPVELIFDVAIGQIFTCRVAGNICTPEIVASIEFGVEEARTPLVMVLGHQSCGAVTAAIEGKTAPGEIDALFLPLRAAIEKAGPDVDAAVKANALIQANLLRTGSPLIADAETQGKVKVVAGYYSLVDGTVTLL